MAKPRNTTSFIPNAREGLLLRSPITQAYTLPNYHSKALLYSRNVRPEMGGYHSEILEDSNTPTLSFYTRHNPHPVRVKHLKGLLGNPVCMVEDNLERRILWSAPSGEDLTVSYRPPRSTRYSANTSKHLAAVGIVPVTYAWRDELEKKTYNAISKALNQTSFAPSQHTTSKTDDKKEFDSMEDNQLLSILCKILQTDSISACQAWLQSASETEKTIVLNMLRMAATGEINQLTQSCTPKPSRPNTAQSIYVWKNHDSDQLEEKEQDTELWNNCKDPVQSEERPFKLPTHDTIIRSAHSRVSMKNGNEKKNFHDRLQNELDQVETTRMARMQSRGSLRPVSSSSRPTSAELISRRSFSRSRNRPRSSSVGSKTDEIVLPIPPVRVQVTGASNYWKAS